MKKSFADASVQIDAAKDYDAAVKLVYQWVKQDVINPHTMQGLIVYAYKVFVY